MDKLGVVGLGVLGIPLSLVLAKHFSVVGVDVNKETIKRNLEKSRLHEPYVKEYLELFNDNLMFTDNFGNIERCPVVFIIVQTPLNEDTEKLDMKYVRSALEQVHEVNPACLTVISSTLNIGELRELRKTQRFLSYNPEFVARGNIIKGFEKPKFVLVGAFHRNHAETIRKIWRKVTSATCYIMSPEEAEITKICANLSLVVQMNFANVVGQVCKSFGADPNKVLDVLHLDVRNYKAGLGAGGPCFSKDLDSFVTACKEKGVEVSDKFGSFLKELNDYWVRHYLGQIISCGKRKIAVLGITYKPTVPFIVGSQSATITQALLNLGYEVHVYDEHEEEAKATLEGNVHFHDCQKDCLDEAEVVFVGTVNFKNVETEKPIVNPWV